LSQQFPRDKRLVTAADYRRVFSDPKKSADAFFTVLARARQADAGGPRLGLAIAKKQLRNATDRNRVKRLARENFRCNETLVDGIDFVVLTRASARQASNRTLNDSLSRHFRRLAKICTGPQA
jgi:ribonuclease P protein component